MKPFGILIAASASTLVLAACDSNGSGATPPVAADASATAVPAEDADVAASPDAPVVAGAPAAVGLTPASNAPAFAVIYPDAALSQPAVTANGPDGPGGMVEFTTSASPDDVVDYYRELAAKAGLKPVMSMNQGHARAFAALNTAGAEVQVVASPTEDGSTSTQLTWKAGR